MIYTVSKHTRLFDVDIDCVSNTDKTKYGIRSMVYNDKTERILPHPSGIILDDVPIDKETGLAAIDYKTAEELDIITVDLLTNTSYNSFRSKEEIVEMSQREPSWKMFEHEKFVSKLPHIGTHFEIVSRIKPKDINTLADILALIRPGKSHLIDAYIRNPKLVRRELYKRPTNGQAYFKKSHSYSYALMIVTIANKINMFGLY